MERKVSNYSFNLHLDEIYEKFFWFEVFLTTDTRAEIPLKPVVEDHDEADCSPATCGG